jgi:CBS domain-containing protein
VLAAWGIRAPQSVDAFAAWLGYINLALLAFNMLPALPLDGGRVLRSILWGARANFQWATRVAASIGRGFAYLFIAAGIFSFIFQGSFSGAWLAFIGWFLLQAATAEDRYLLVHGALGDLRVADVMVRDPVTVAPHLSIGRFMDQVAWERRYTTYPVVEDNHVLGLLAFRCVAAVPRAEWDTRLVGDCMIPRERVPILRTTQSAVEALATLSDGDVHRGLVLDADRLVGFLSITDLSRALEVRGRTREQLRAA